MPFVNFASLGIPGNAVSQGGATGASSQIQNAFTKKWRRAASQSELDTILSGKDLDIPDVLTSTGSTSGSQGTNGQVSEKWIEQDRESQTGDGAGTGAGATAEAPPLPGSPGTVEDIVEATQSVAVATDPDPADKFPTGYDSWQALADYNAANLPTLENPMWNVLDRSEGFKDGLRLFDPTRYGTAPANAWANLMAQGKGPAPGQTSVWYRDVFLPEVKRVQANQSTTVKVNGDDGGDGDGGASDQGQSLIEQLKALFQGAGFDIGAGQFNLPDPTELFSGITGGISEANIALEALGISDEVIKRLDRIAKFQAPATFGQFERGVGTVSDILGEGGQIGGFTTPTDFTTFESDVNTLLGQLGEGGELGTSIAGGRLGVAGIQQAVDDLLKGSFRGQEGLFSNIGLAREQVSGRGGLDEALQALAVPDLNLGGLTIKARGLRDILGEGKRHVEGIGTAAEGDVLQQLISALSSGNIGQLESILDMFRGPEAITVEGGLLTRGQLDAGLQQQLGPEGDLFGSIGNILSKLGGLEGDLSEGLKGLLTQGQLAEGLEPIAAGQTGIKDILGDPGIGGQLSDILAGLTTEGELGGQLSSILSELGEGGGIQGLISGPGGLQQTVSGIPGLTDSMSELIRLFGGVLTPENLPDALKGQFPGLTGLEGFLGTDGLGGGFNQGIDDIKEYIANLGIGGGEQDFSDIIAAINALGEGSFGGKRYEGDEGDAVFGDTAGFLQTLENAITGDLGIPEQTAESLRADPRTASFLADFAKRQEEIEAQNEERLKRFGVLRGGDTADQFLRDAEARTRGEFDILGDAATRADARRAVALGAGNILGSTRASRELGLGGLLGRVDGEQTLGGRQADLNTLAGIIAALDPKLDLGTTSKRQMGLATVLANLLPAGMKQDFLDRVANVKGKV